MFKVLLLAAIVMAVGLSYEVRCQDTAQRTQELVAALDKTKYKKKEKKNISIEIYIDIKNDPIAKANPVEYTGSYRGEDQGYQLDLQAVANGTATGTGRDMVDSENAVSRTFTLRDAHIHGALLTGTKVYDNGQTETFEALFTNRTVSSGRNANEVTDRKTTFGIGFIQNQGTWTNRVFLERK